MDIIRLSDRLQIIVDMVQHGAKVIDVGTDHGYVPVYLAQRNMATHIIASDINQAPLDKAVATAMEYGIDNIEFRLMNGLQGLTPGEVDTVIIAGMGGETIAAILDEAKWAKKCSLILQPMSKRERLSQWLRDNELKVIDERLVKEKGGIHSILLVGSGCDDDISYAGLYVSMALSKSGDPLFQRYLNGLIRKVEHARTGLEKSSNEGMKSKLTELVQLVTELDALKGKEND